MGTVHFGNDHVAAIKGYGDLQFCVWIPTGREFTLKDGDLIIAKSRQVETSYACDSDLSSNPMEPSSIRFPNTNSSVIGRLSKFVFGSSTRVAPSTCPGI